MTTTLPYRPTFEIIGSFLDRAPVNLFAMAQGLGISVAEKTDWPQSIAGSLECRKGGYSIKINGNHSESKKRFTLAHQIAHYALHRDLIGRGIVDDANYKSSLSDRMESQANQIATTLLMPGPLICREWAAGARSITAIAAKFDVRPAAAEIRLKGMGLISNSSAPAP
ncbi:MAG: ImmA/IrrE family metallo-endopeptidase [Alphaproteobacteria bacterium]